MGDKEWLEEIKHYFDKQRRTPMKIIPYDKIDWHNEQDERVQELETELKKEKKKHKKTRQHFDRYKRKTSENWRNQRATQNRNKQLEYGVDLLDKEIARYREAFEKIKEML